MERILRNWLGCGAVLAVAMCVCSGCVVKEKERPVVVHEHATPVVVHEKEVVRDPPVTEHRVLTERERTVTHD